MKRPSRLYRVYVDEAGGRFISPKSDNMFVVSAAVVHDDWDVRVRNGLRDLKVALGRRPDHVLHFSNLSRPKRLAAATGIAGLPLAALTNVIVSKERLGEPLPTGDLAFISNPDPMYLWAALRLLLERVSWFVEARGGEAVVTFSHVRGVDPQQLHGYRTALEASDDVKIDWQRFDDHPFRVDSPKNVELLQVADTAASSIYHAVQPGADGPRYLRELRPRLYRGIPPLRSPGVVTSYGLKVFPDKEAEAGGWLNWLRSY